MISFLRKFIWMNVLRNEIVEINVTITYLEIYLKLLYITTATSFCSKLYI